MTNKTQQFKDVIGFDEEDQYNFYYLYMDKEFEVGEAVKIYRGEEDFPTDEKDFVKFEVVHYSEKYDNVNLECGDADRVTEIVVLYNGDYFKFRNVYSSWGDGEFSLTQVAPKTVEVVVYEEVK
jgi:hypothetical protein